MKAVVVGSGPSGIAAAHALLARGHEVTMLDGGRDLEPYRDSARSTFADRGPSGWSADDRAAWQSAQLDAPAGQVRRYGSDFALEAPDATFADGAQAFQLRASRALGGLSNLWGSAVLPYAPSDMRGWPIAADDLAPHYRAVAAFLPISGRVDALQAAFPGLDMQGRTPLPSSPQATRLAERLAAATDSLAAAGVTAGLARQAVAAGCRTCSQCLHGCPWQLIWSGRHELPRLRERSGFRHRAGVVRALRERADGVVLELEGGETLTADRAFLGAGVLETARILLASRPDLGALTLRDSAHGFLPFLHRWRAPVRPGTGAFHTLCQMFVELDDPTVSPWRVHAQLYTWNEYYDRDLRRSYGRLPGSAAALGALARRLIVAQVFLHSDHSASARLTLARDGRLAAELVANPATALAFDRATRTLAGAIGPAGGLSALRFARRLNPPGSAFHAGASLPMAREPKGAESDRLGRPAGARRVHVIDASVLPAIPATTITLPVMANAHRIAASL